MLRIGKVSSINEKTGMVMVTYADRDDSVTDELPLMSVNGGYSRLKIGQDVIALHMENGSSRGVILGGIWNEKNKPAETDGYRQELSGTKDVAYIKYSDEAGEYLVRIPNIRINGINKTILEGPTVQIGANKNIQMETEEIELKIGICRIEADEGEFLVSGLSDIKLQAAERVLRGIVREYGMEAAEKLLLKAGSDIEAKAEGSLLLEADAVKIKGEDLQLEASGELILKDSTGSISVKEIIEKLGGMGE